ncbi:Tip elongation protein [Lachnellula occidentalis]|uniref:Tip elongation protein n=1 Tax=Lachnellula occidentalis TaxID=215460 RepID=A0A8H8S923_9HELO|nr:Tip elongation protein [Lachnellula occidentalis]
MSTFTPRRSLARPRPSNSLNTASSPNLSASYSGPRNAEAYGGMTIMMHEDPRTNRNNMAPFTPSHAADGEDVDVGDRVDVPGNMHGTVKFKGSVQNKKGVFAGVELSEEFARRGKNNGDVDGISYFVTSIPGAGIFLPINKATRRGTPSSRDGSFPHTPSTPSAGSSLKAAGQISRTYTPPTPSLPKFSQSVGPGRVPSPQFKMSRPSLPRPESPLRRPQLTNRPSNIGNTQTPSRYASPAPAKFGQSVRGTKDSGDPSKRGGYMPRNGMNASVGPRSASVLGQTPTLNISDDELPPIGVAQTTNNGSMGSISSFNSKMRPASRAASRAASRLNDDESDRLRGQLEERDRQLKEQASALAEMESSLVEVQTLMNNPEGTPRQHRGSMEDKDATQLRAVLREKNEKIAMLTAEFDAHRADFRSTIDTLELASTETERVYEKRVEDLLQDIRELQERSEDVDSVARQLKQLEELVQELEEGLEDARRGEAEARGEVEFLRGEVERTRSELRREREKAAASLNGGANGDSGTASKEVEQRDDEIRGLKAIIHSLSRDAVPDVGSAISDLQKTPTQKQEILTRNRHPSNGGDSTEERLAREKIERELLDLRSVIESKNNREEELEREVERLRRGSASDPASQRASGITIGSSGTVTHDHSSTRDSKGTVVSWRDRELQRSPETHRRANTLETMPESDAYSSANESFCELCETSGHDILTCTNMFTPSGTQREPSQQRTGKDVVKEGLKGLSPSTSDYKPAPLSPIKSPRPTAITPVRIIPNPMESGPVAGKESGVVNMDKWCGVCEREGHESIDCPFEDAF